MRRAPPPPRAQSLNRVAPLRDVAGFRAAHPPPGRGALPGALPDGGGRQRRDDPEVHPQAEETVAAFARVRPGARGRDAHLRVRIQGHGEPHADDELRHAHHDGRRV
eukprot:3690705-Prymnesium_polylepis.1